ncbi:oligoendopeptidase F [Paenibacillus sp. S-12]|uniref:oligoendopeptidase F n=1 Tax=Paenibacillus sp. S-12 TaxID=3031371 RepID=UPI0025A1A900|nr:oligoendopeptidase F [Paenibacillus sp. S-12]
MAAQAVRMKRSEVPLEATWRLEDLFESEAKWLEELQAITSDLGSVTRFTGKLHEDAGTLLACLEAMEVIWKREQLCGSYAHLRWTEDSTNPVNQGNNSRAQDMLAEVSVALSFFESEVSDMGDEVLSAFYEEEPKLLEFKPYLDQIASKKPYRLSSETESTLAALGSVLRAPYKIYNQIKLSDMSFESVTDQEGTTYPLSFALFESRYVGSPNTYLRREAFRSFSETLYAHRNGIAAAYATEVKKQVVLAKLRGYDHVTDMLLHNQQVTKQMYNAILDTIQTELAPHMRRWANLKKRVLELDELRFSDLHAPFDPEYNPEISFEAAARQVEEALQVMGPEYAAIIGEAIQNRWIDYADNVGKSTGAFCSSIYDAHSYILMTWTGSMRGAFTLAHELGHAGHFMLAHKHQRITNTRPSLYFIEAPSTMNEMLLADHLFRQSNDPRMRRWIITQLLSTYYHNFVTHLLEGEMQRRVYELASQGEPITADLLSQLKGQVQSDFWGDAVVMDPGSELTWMRQPHYYMSLYPYTYSAGLTASTAAAKRIREEGQPAVERWLTALKAGGSLPPLELMKLAGVDMSDTNTIREAVSYVGELVDELVRLYEQ